MATKRKRINGEDNRKKSTSKARSTVQRALSNSKRELDNREYDQGYALDAKEVCSDKRKEKNQRSGKGLFNPVESAVGLANVPENPPIPLFEANSIIEIAESFWGLAEGSIRGRSRVFHILWPRYVVCGILRSKGYTYQAVGDVLDRDHGSIMNACEQYKAITETLPKYQEQAVQFDRYLWSKLTTNSRNGYNTVTLRT